MGATCWRRDAGRPTRGAHTCNVQICTTQCGARTRRRAPTMVSSRRSTGHRGHHCCRAGGGCSGRRRGNSMMLVHGSNEGTGWTGSEEWRRVCGQHLVQLLLMLPILGSTILKPNLYASLVQFGCPGQLFATINIRIVALGKGCFQIA